MFTVDNGIKVRSPRAHVWTVLTAFETFEQWHPYLWISGHAVHNEPIRYGLKELAGMPVRRSVPARVVHLHPEQTVGWRLSIPRLLTIEEIYLLSGSGSLTSVQHQVRCAGPISGLIRHLVTRRVKPLLEKADAALAARLEGEVINTGRARSGRGRLGRR